MSEDEDRQPLHVHAPVSVKLGAGQRWRAVTYDERYGDASFAASLVESVMQEHNGGGTVESAARRVLAAMRVNGYGRLEGGGTANPPAVNREAV